MIGMNRVIYLDNNATTALDPAVLEAMEPYLRELSGNASSRHALGRHARRAIDQAARQIADALNADPKGIVFTSGATEANNLAAFAVASSRPEGEGSHALVSPSEHPSVLEPVRQFRKRGWEVEELTLDGEGRVADLAERIRDDTTAVFIQLANSETGCLQPIKEFRRLLPERIQFHCDAVQAVGKVLVDWQSLGVSTLSLSGHKLHGPAGIGALLARAESRPASLFFGGHQQGGLRPGTEPVAAIVGLGKAVELAVERLEENQRILAMLRDRLEGRLFARIDGAVRNGPEKDRLPNTTNISFPGVKAEPQLIALDMLGVCCSAGTACASGSLEPSAVLKAMHLQSERLESAIRFSVSRFTTVEEIDDAVVRIERAVRQARVSMAFYNP